MTDERSTTPEYPPDAPTLVSPPSHAFHQSWAVIIGIDGYAQGIPPLRTAVNDARQLAQILAQQEYRVRLFDREVTQDTLQKLLTVTLPRDVGPDDRVLFYFAGHGVALDGDDGPAGYLVPQDARQEERDSFLPMHEVHQALTALPCRHLLAVLDCCFAGAFRWSSTRDIKPLPEVIHREQYERFIIDPAWQVITSAAYDQKALDFLTGNVYGSRGEIRKHSPFARALFDALAGAGDVVPPGEGDGVITATELYLYLRDNVEILAEERTGRRQTPSLWPLNKHDRGEYIFLVPERDLNLPPAPPLTFENNPYRGLQSYDEEHSELFFGRTQIIKELADKVANQRLTVVLGASGTGKSSLVKAGLLPYLGGTHQTDVLDTRDNPWFILQPFRPGPSPIRSLNAILSEDIQELVEPGAFDASGAHSSQLSDVIATWAQENPSRKMMLVIDQFEELITLCQEEEERDAFVNALSRAIKDHPKILRLVLTLRSDFEPQFSKSSLATYWTPARYLVPPMSQDELREVIEGPASVRVLYFEPYELVENLINEVVLTPGALPLLSFTLSELYVQYLESRRDNRALTREDYEALGGVVGSLRNRATAEHDQLDETHQQTMRRIMLRMVAVEGGELARRRAPRYELVYTDPEENRRVETVLQKLVRARLLVKGKDESGEAYVEPAHDALVRAWDRLLVWQRQAEEYLPLQRRVAQAAIDWDHTTDTKAKTRLLWNDNPRLPQVQEAVVTQVPLRKGMANLAQQARRALWPELGEPKRSTWLNRLETEFVRQSVVRQATVLRRVVFTAAGVILALTALTVVALISRGAAIRSEENEAAARVDAENSASTAVFEAQVRATAQANEAAARVEAEEKAALARSRELAALVNLDLREGNIAQALQRAAQAYRTAPTTESEQALYNAVIQPWPEAIFDSHDFAVDVMRISPNGDLAFTASDDEGTAYIWDVESGDVQAAISGHGAIITSANFSIDGDLIVTASADGTARLWDVANGQELTRLQGHDAVVSYATFSPDGELVLTTGEDGTARLWDAQNGSQVAVLQSSGGAVSSGDFSPDGSMIVTANDDGTAQVWDVEDRQELLLLEGHTQRISYVSFSPDGDRILTASLDETARVWDARAGYPLAILQGHTQTITAASFDPNGDRIVTASLDNSAKVWDSETGEELFSLDAHTSRVTAASFSPDGKWLVTSGWDGRARIWDAQNGEEWASLAAHSERFVNWAGFSPDGKQILTAGYGEAMVWNASGRGEANVLNPSGWIENADFSPDGSLVVTASWNGTANVWNVDTGEEMAVLDSGDSAVLSAIFSSDGEKVVTTNGNGSAVVWDLESGKILADVQDQTGSINSAIFSIDGLQILTTGDDGVARLWDIETGQELKRFEGHEGSVTSAAFSPDGTRILTASTDQTARIWDVTSGEELFQFVGHEDWLTSATFDDTGERVLTSGFDGRVIVWDAVTGERLLVLNPPSLEILSASFSPDGTRIVTAGNNPYIAQLWAVNSGQELARFEGHTRDILRVSFSPDGSQIVTASRDNTARVWDVFTGVELRYLDGHRDDVYWVSFSPDGRRIVTTSHDGTARLWPAGAEELLRIAEGRLAGIGLGVAKEQGQLAYVSFRNGNADIFVSDSEDSYLQQLTDDPAEDTDPSWAQDGSRIAFCSDRDGDMELYVMSADGSDLAQLTNDPAKDCGPSWSPDGSRIAFSSDRDGDSEIYLMNSNGTNIVQITDDPAEDLDPAWSPDGSRIAFSSDRDGDLDIYLIEDDGSKIFQLTDTFGDETSPTWSPDGRQLAYNSRIIGGWDVYVMKTDSISLPILITDDVANDLVGSWTSGGDYLVIYSDREGDFEVYLIDIEESTIIQVTDHPADDVMPDWR